MPWNRELICRCIDIRLRPRASRSSCSEGASPRSFSTTGDESRNGRSSIGVYGFDIAPGVWHGSLVLEPGTVVFEVKPGPYVPVGAVDLAPWTPAADDAEAVGRFLAWLREQVPPSE